MKVFKNQAGGLEEIRSKLGLRPSQICEILKVHPSAWTRWVKTGRAPPHIYQMLDWYLEILKWRGQNNLQNPLQNHLVDSAPQKLEALERRWLQDVTKTDPATYVPQTSTEHQNLPPDPAEAVQEMSAQNRTGSVRANLLNSTKIPPMTWLLLGMWALQTLLWGAIITILLKRGSP